MEPQGPVEGGSSSGPETAAEGAQEQTAPPDAGSLVNRMIAAGEWPEPALVEQILAAGEAAVEPLREVLETRPMGWPAEAPLVHAVGLLSMLRPPSALPDLIAVARFYKSETGDVMANAIAKYGLEGFDALLELIGDPSIAGYHRTYFIDGAKRAAGDDPVLRARIAEVLRQVFTRVVGEVRESQALEQELLDSEDEEDGDDEDNVDLHGEFIEEIDEDDPEMVDDEELENLSGEAVEDPGAEEARQPGESDDLEAIHRMDADNEIYPDDALSLLASDLSDLADPLARDMIQSAFDEGLIDDCIIDPDSVMSIYERGGKAYEQKAPWLQEYSASYFEEIRIREGLARMPQVQFPSRTSYPSFAPAKEAPPAPVQPVEPFRYAAPKIGRNDPCWCGSGKKYKRCHLGKDAP